MNDDAAAAPRIALYQPYCLTRDAPMRIHSGGLSAPVEYSARMTTPTYQKKLTVSTWPLLGPSSAARGSWSADEGRRATCRRKAGRELAAAVSSGDHRAARHVRVDERTHGAPDRPRTRQARRGSKRRLPRAERRSASSRWGACMTWLARYVSPLVASIHRWSPIEAGPSVGRRSSRPLRTARQPQTMSYAASMWKPSQQASRRLFELRKTRKPVDEAHLLPPRVFHDPEVFAFERDNWFARTWLCVAREADFGQPGTYALVEVGGESVIVVRGRDDVLRAFHNVCRHRGSTLVDRTRRRRHRAHRALPVSVPRVDLRPRRLAPTRAAHRRDLIDFRRGRQRAAADPTRDLGGLRIRQSRPRCRRARPPTWPTFPPRSSAYPIDGLRRARRIEYEVAANWKVIGENYSECYHCPGVHPQLNRLSPYDRGRNLESNGPWAGGWMELVDDADTMSDGRSRHTAARRSRASARRTSAASTTSSCGRTCCSACIPTT